MKPPPSDDKASTFEDMQDMMRVGKSLELNSSEEVLLRTDYFIDLVFNPGHEMKIKIKLRE